MSATKSTSSPSDFTTRPWLDTTVSAAFSSNRSSSAASSLMSVCRTVLVYPTMSANPITVVAVDSSSAGDARIRPTAATRCRRQV